MPTLLTPPDVVAAVPKSRDAFGRLAAKQRAVADLIGGRLSLLEAAARFRAAQERPEEPEQACRTVIGWVDLALAERPEQAELVTAKLESELLSSRDRAGRVALPRGG